MPLGKLEGRLYISMYSTPLTKFLQLVHPRRWTSPLPRHITQGSYERVMGVRISNKDGWVKPVAMYEQGRGLEKYVDQTNNTSYYSI